jgi:hypothetical protein
MKKYSKYIPLTILILNPIVLYFGRMYFPEFFKVSKIDFATTWSLIYFFELVIGFFIFLFINFKKPLNI